MIKFHLKSQTYAIFQIDFKEIWLKLNGTKVFLNKTKCQATIMKVFKTF